MDRRQSERQILYLLRSALWAVDPLVVTSPSAVLTDAFASSRPADELLALRGAPFAVLRPDGDDADQDQPGRYSSARHEVQVVVSGQGHPAAQDALLGANRASLIVSPGAGADQVAGRLEELYATLVASTHGVQGRLARTRPPVTAGVDAQAVVVPFDLEILDETAGRTYATAQRFRATGGAGQIALAWSLPPDRFDRLRVVLRRASGSTPPATPSDGSPVTLSGDLATSVTDSGLAAGTYAYALFAAYDDNADPPATVAATVTSYSPSVSVVAVAT